MEARDRYHGCLAVGAVGDALGAPVEFWSVAEIRERLGPSGVTGFVGTDVAVTDDTQMTLFTAEGLIRASVRLRGKGIAHLPTVVHHAYQRWLHTQGVPWEQARPGSPSEAPDGWLVTERRLHRLRAPGTTCLSALRSGRMGTTTEPINDSKGCGGVMRVAPVGLFVPGTDEAFRVAAEVAAVTHGHPSGWLSAGALAAVIAAVLEGADLAAAVEQAVSILRRWPSHEETAAAVDAAVELAGSGLPEPEQLEALGGAWVGEEALAIALACALADAEPRAALLASVNHSGDSDSTGAICGHLLGVLHGPGAVPREWVDAIDVGDLAQRLADDLWTEGHASPSDEHGYPTEEWRRSYPGW